MTLSQINQLPNDDLKIWRICRELKSEEAIIKAAGNLGISLQMIKGQLSYQRDDGNVIGIKPDEHMCHPRSVT